MLLDVRPQDSSGLDLQRSCAGADDAAGTIDFLQKPVPPKKLLEHIREALEIDRQARTVAAQRAVVVEGIARLTWRER